MRTSQPTRIQTGRAAVTLVASLILVCATVSASARVVLLVEDGDGNPLISGESKDRNHPGWIDAIAIGTGFEKLPTSPGGYAERRARLVVPDAFVVTKEFDKSSPKFQEALLDAAELPVVKVKYLITDAAGAASEPMMIELRRVSVVEYEIGNFGNDPVFAEPPTEFVSLSFKEIRWLYRYEDPDTGAEEEEEFGWDNSYTTASEDEDSDGDGTNNAEDPDDDNDGIPDEDELAALLNPLANDTLFDFDQDDQLNIDEWRSGTDANSGRSFFAIQSLALRDEPGGPVVAIRLPVAPGRLYRLLGSFDLRDPDSWIVLEEFPIPGEPGGVAEMAELALPPGAITQFHRMFFKVSVEFSSGNAGFPDPN